MSRKRVLFFHCVKNIMPSFISLMAISLQHVIEGTYIVEMVFSYPGIGTLSFESAKYHDYNMLMVLCVFTGIFVIAGNVIGQSVSEWIDPRMKEIKMTGKADTSVVLPQEDIPLYTMHSGIRISFRKLEDTCLHYCSNSKMNINPFTEI